MVFRVIPSSCHDCPSSGKDDERLQQREGCIAVARGYSVRGSCIFGTQEATRHEIFPNV